MVAGAVRSTQKPGIPGWATKDPLALCPCIREKFLSLFEQSSTDLVVIETGRDEERQHHYLRTGVSQTMYSKHLPQPPNGKSIAFDVCPKPYLKEKGWAPGGPLWTQVAEAGKGLGLSWGGDWPNFKDRPHFQLDECSCWKKVTA